MPFTGVRHRTFSNGKLTRRTLRRPAFVDLIDAQSTSNTTSKIYTHRENLWRGVNDNRWAFWDSSCGYLGLDLLLP